MDFSIQTRLTVKKHIDHILSIFLFFTIVLLVAPKTALPFEVVFDSEKTLLDIDLEALSPAVHKAYVDGANHYKTKNFNKAFESFQVALQKAQLGGDQREVGYCLLSLGIVQAGGYQAFSESIKFFSASIPHFKKAGDLKGQGKALLGIVYSHNGKGEFAQALDASTSLLTIVSTLLEDVAENEKHEILRVRGILFGNLGDMATKLGRFDDSVLNFHLASADFAQLQNFEWAGFALWQSGDVLRFRIANYKRAIEDYAIASSFFAKAGKLHDSMRLNLAIGWCHYSLRNIDKSIEYFGNAFDYAKNAKLPDLATYAAFALATVVGDSPEGLERCVAYSNLTLEYAAQAGNTLLDPLPKPSALYLKGKALGALGFYDEAIESLHSSALLFQQFSIPERDAEAYMELGRMLSGLGDNERSRRYYERALKSFAQSGNKMKQAQVMAMLADILIRSESHDAQQVSEYIMKSRELIEAAVRTAKIDRATIFQQLFDRSLGFENIAKAQYYSDFRTRFPDADQGSLMLTATLFAIFEANNYAYQEWVKIAPTLGEYYLLAEAKHAQMFGQEMLNRGDSEQAVNAFLNAYLLHRFLPWRRDTGLALLEDHIFLSIALVKAKRAKEALERLLFAEQLAHTMRVTELYAIHALLAITYGELGDPVNSDHYFRKAISGLASIRGMQTVQPTRIDFLAANLPFLHAYIDFLLKRYEVSKDPRYIEDAFQVGEKLKAQSFLDMIVRSCQIRSTNDPQSSFFKTDEIHRRMELLHTKMRAQQNTAKTELRLLLELNELRQRIEQQRGVEEKEPSSSTKLEFADTVSLSEVQAALDEDSVFFDYITTERGSWLWAITKREVDFYTLPGESALPTLMNFLATVREPLVGNDDWKRHINLGQEVYRLGIQPAEKQLRGKKKLIIAPDGPLHYLPFEALIMPNPGKESRSRISISTIPYLFKEYQVTYVPSATIFVMQSKVGISRVQAPLPVLAFGDPAYEKGISLDPSRINPTQQTNAAVRDFKLTRLPFSGEEVRRIAGIWGISIPSEHINLGKKASANRLKELDISRYRIIHMACHGILADQVKWATQPALVLSPVTESESSSLLQLSDILDLKLNADLVVLSACNTGLGQLKDGEGIIGLTRGFMYAGASSVLVSLWEVEDQSTCLLMERFHSYLKEGKQKGDALRKAKLDLLNSEIVLEALVMKQRLASPFYWAPFVLIGDWK